MPCLSNTFHGKLRRFNTFDLSALSGYNTVMEISLIKDYEDKAAHIRRNLGEDAADFLASLALDCKRALRVNTLKADAASIAEKLGLDKPSPYCKDAFLLSDEKIGGNHPYHHAGLIYFQEPSAMLAVEAARPILIEKFSQTAHPLVLDMCAAPGGKSGQLAALMQGRGMLVSNETVYKRTLPLKSNLTRLGVRASMITSVSATTAANLLCGVFDAVAVDAPCSGEGMLRKELAAWDNMNEKTMLACAARQKEIVACADVCLKEGGILVYSTCTLNRTENEEVILPLLQNGRFEAVECPHLNAVRKSSDFPAYRAYPQDGYGEGHFVCVLRKLASAPPPPRFSSPFDIKPPGIKLLTDALSPLCRQPLFAQPHVFRDEVFLCPPAPYVKGLSVVRMGVKAADVVNGRIVPCHDYAAALKSDDAVNKLDLPFAACSDEKLPQKPRQEIYAYLKGMRLSSAPPFNGYGLVCADSYPLGLIKAGADGVNNRYPKGLRLPPSFSPT